MSRPQVDDHGTTAVRVLRCWAPLQGRGPVAMGLDDVQWMDLPSSQAIIFAVRLLVACRTELSASSEHPVTLACARMRT